MATPHRSSQEPKGGVLRYVLLVCDDENAELSSEEVEQTIAGYAAFQDEMQARGLLVGRERLRPTSSATTVRVREGDLVVADGPFAETKEQVAGFFVVECSDLDEAIEVAAKIPNAQSGTIEVRPAWEF
jgi:hypothetical protein